MTADITPAELAARLEGLSREYRASMDKDVLHSWAGDVVQLLPTLIAALRAGEALEGYRAAASYIAADSWDRCSDCFDILRMARAADYDWYWTPDETAHALRRLRERSGQAALSTPAKDEG